MTKVPDPMRRRRRGDPRRNDGRVTVKLAMAAAAVFLVLSPTPSRADCPDGICPTARGSIRCGNARRRAGTGEHQVRKDRCVNECSRAVCGNLHFDVCVHELWAFRVGAAMGSWR